MTTIVKTTDVQVGDRVGREMGKSGPLMWLTVTKVDEEIIHCNLWQFDRKTGAEIDHELKWGPEYGKTGSYIVQVVRAPENN